MKQQEMLVRLQDMIAPYLENPCEIGMETDLIKDLAINSFDFVNIVIEIENTFGCSVSDKQMIKMRLVKDMIQHIEEGYHATKG